MKRSITIGGAVALLALAASHAQDTQQRKARSGNQGDTEESRSLGECSALPGYNAVTDALREIVEPGNKEKNGGLGNNMWATVVDRSGRICLITRSGEAVGDQWPGSRSISAKKAYTANAFSLGNFALSTANLYFPAQPGGSLYALETSNPLDTAIYESPARQWGTRQDPAVGNRLGGTTLFAGGLALYSPEGELLGGLGLSGDKSCTDHVIAWKLRHALNLDNVPSGVHPGGTDNAIYDIVVDPASGRLTSASGYGHPKCGARAVEIARGFDETAPTGPER